MWVWTPASGICDPYVSLSVRRPMGMDGGGHVRTQSQREGTVACHGVPRRRRRRRLLGRSHSHVVLGGSFSFLLLLPFLCGAEITKGRLQNKKQKSVSAFEIEGSDYMPPNTPPVCPHTCLPTHPHHLAAGFPKEGLRVGRLSGTAGQPTSSPHADTQAGASPLLVEEEA